GPNALRDRGVRRVRQVDGERLVRLGDDVTVHDDDDRLREVSFGEGDLPRRGDIVGSANRRTGARRRAVRRRIVDGHDSLYRLGGPDRERQRCRAEVALEDGHAVDRERGSADAAITTVTEHRPVRSRVVRATVTGRRREGPAIFSTEEPTDASTAAI